MVSVKQKFGIRFTLVNISSPTLSPNLWRWTMARKFAKRYLKPTAFEAQGSLFEGLVWTLPSSRGDKTYNITLDPQGFECDCTGFAFHGRCKHSQQILKQV